MPAKVPAGKCLILMADIVDSNSYSDVDWYRAFRKVVQEVDRKQRKALLSPLTVTLGDEFQGVLKNVESALNVILAIEEGLLNTGHEIRLRYVLEEGEIGTPLNRKVAHGMIGSGLSSAREHLELLKSDEPETAFAFYLDDPVLSRQLNLGFLLLGKHTEYWRHRGDSQLAHRFIELKDYKLVAEAEGRDPSSTWRKEKTLRMKEYFALKELIYSIVKMQT